MLQTTTIRQEIQTNRRKLKHLQLEAKEESEELVHKESRKIVSETDRLLLADFNFKELRF
jgi:hypothetical protein